MAGNKNVFNDTVATHSGQQIGPSEAGNPNLSPERFKNLAPKAQLRHIEAVTVTPSSEQTFGESGSAPAKPRPKVVDQDSGQVTDLGETIDERELARSRGRFVAGGGRIDTSDAPARSITTPTDRNANSKESLKAVGEHYQVLDAFARTHDGAIRTAGRAVPGAFKTHAQATKVLAGVSTSLANARAAFAERNSAKGNGHLKEIINGLNQAHGLLNSSSVREVTNAQVPIHADELASWKSHISKLPSFRRQGKPFTEANVAGTRLKTGTPLFEEIRKGNKGNILGEKMDRAKAGTPRTPKWERGEVAPADRSQKGTGAIDTTSRGTRTGTTGELDPRKKASSKTRVRTRIDRVNLPKIGDMTPKKRMKPGDKLEGR